MPQDARHGAPEVFDSQGSAATASLLSILHASVSALSVVEALSPLACESKLSRHEVRLANPLNLSI